MRNIYGGSKYGYLFLFNDLIKMRIKQINKILLRKKKEGK